MHRPSEFERSTLKHENIPMSEADDFTSVDLSDDKQTRKPTAGGMKPNVFEATPQPVDDDKESDVFQAKDAVTKAPPKRKSDN